MNEMIRRWMWLLLCCGLTACAATPTSLSEGVEEREEVVSLDEACAEDGTLITLCDAEQCGLYRCQDVMQQRAAGRVVPAFSGQPVLPAPGGTAQRYWGSADGLPEPSQPVFIIPWGPKPPLLPSQKKMLEELEAEWRLPHERHHIFPQQRELAEWFNRKGIDIHKYTILLLIEKHRSIHQPPPPGGAWNEAWRKYKRTHEGATKEEIFRYAGQLLYEFQLLGPVVPYYRRWTQAPPIGGM